MAIDAGIYSQIQQPQQQNPLNALAQAYQIKGYQSQMDKADRAEQQQNKLLQLVGSPEFSRLDAQGKANALQGVGDFENAGRVITTAAAANKDQRAAEVSGLDIKLKQLDRAAQIAGTVSDQASYDRALPLMREIGFDISKFSPQYNPEGVRQFAMSALTEKDRLANQTQIRGQDITMRGQDLTQQTALRGQDLSRQTAVEGQQVTTRGQDLSASTTRRGQDLADARAGQAAGKQTEDQAKATGWLIQAQNALDNMNKVGFDKEGNPTSAAYPGINDALERLPVVGGLANTMRTPDRQKFINAASEFSEAMLRAATGAGVNENEARQKIEAFTPRFGEDAETTKQKHAAATLYMDGLKARAGATGAKTADQALSARPSNTGPIKVTNAADYANVPSGATYTTPDGKTRRKP